MIDELFAQFIDADHSLAHRTLARRDGLIDYDVYLPARQPFAALVLVTWIVVPPTGAKRTTDNT